MLGLNGSFLISPTTFTFAFWEDDEMDQFIHIERAEPGEINLGQLWEIDRLVESIDGEPLNSEREPSSAPLYFKQPKKSKIVERINRCKPLPEILISLPTNIVVEFRANMAAKMALLRRIVVTRILLSAFLARITTIG